MLEKEIKFIYDFNINVIKQLGIYFTIEDIKRNNIHPAIFKYLSAEIDYQIFEDRRNLLKNSAFNYSGEKINEYFSYINDEIKKTKRFFHKDISDLLLQAISFNTNLLTQPKATILEFIFDKNDVKSISEIKQSLNYLYYYQYLKQIILSYFSQKKLISINKNEFEKLLNKIDTLGFETRLNEILTIVVTSMKDFFNIGISPKDSIPLVVIEQYLYEKHLTQHLKKLKEKFPGDNKLRYSSEKIEDIIKNITPLQSEFEKNISASEVVSKQSEDENYESESKTTLESFVEENDEVAVELSENKVEKNKFVEEDETSDFEEIENVVISGDKDDLIEEEINQEIHENEISSINETIENTDEEISDRKLEIEDFSEEIQESLEDTETENADTITDFADDKESKTPSLVNDEKPIELETSIENTNDENFEDRLKLESLKEEKQTGEIFNETLSEEAFIEEEITEGNNNENSLELEIESSTNKIQSEILDENQSNEETTEVTSEQEIYSEGNEAKGPSILEEKISIKDDSGLNHDGTFAIEEGTEIHRTEEIEIDTKEFEKYFDKTFFDIVKNCGDLNVENLYSVLSVQSKPYNNEEFQSIINQITSYDNDYMLEKINLVNRNTFNNNDEEIVDLTNSNEENVVEKKDSSETPSIQNETEPDTDPESLAIEQIEEKEISKDKSSSFEDLTEEEVLSIEGEKFTELKISPSLEEFEIDTESNIWETVNEYAVEHTSKLNDELAGLTMKPDIEMVTDDNIINTKITDSQKDIAMKDFTINDEEEITVVQKEEIPSETMINPNTIIDEEREDNKNLVINEDEETENTILEIVEEDITNEAATEEKETSIDENGKLTISQIRHHEDMPRIIEVVFDYDMIAFNDVCNKISECTHEDEALLIIDNYCKENRINPEGKEASLFKSLISRIYIPE